MTEGIDAPQSSERPSATAIFTVVLVSIAALATGWCAFQSTLWSGKQAFALLDATSANIRSTETHLQANQIVLVDITMFMEWMNARLRHDEAAASFYRERFRPEMRPAFDAWLIAREREPATTAPTPFATPQYQSRERERADALAAESGQAASEAMAFNRTADTYALMTVLFSMVTVLAGLAEKLRHRRARSVLFVVTVVVLIADLLAIAMLPQTWVG